uniref:NADH dehydrogenase subunit 6 n=1 Tax=Nematus trochanteratus TaxID=3029098 RepID=UPI0023D85331|nr:NADH dehydrogenase subunit 6 [Nematus trochanteratus]WDQ45599.1 NADH dehydrogenase subunit 6 [Nematus trochanteratus]
MFQAMLIYILMMNSIMFYYSKTPISMGVYLIIQTMLMSLLSGLMSMSFWYMYIMFLIMIGGMLILFIYMSSLSSNQKFYFQKNKMMFYLLTFLMFFFFLKNLNFYSSFNLDSVDIMNMSMEENFELKMSLNKLYNLPTNLIMLLVMNYLLLTLFITVEVININMGPLRKNI